MSGVLVREEPEISESSDQNKLQHLITNINAFMVNQYQAKLYSYVNLSQISYISQCNCSQAKLLDLIWNFVPNKLGIKIGISPTAIRTLGLDLFISSQRLFVDLCYLMTNLNKLYLNKFKFYITESNTFCIEAYVGYEQLTKPAYLRYILKKITEEIYKILPEIINFMEPYLLFGQTNVKIQ